MLFTNVKRKAEEGLSREQIEYRERYQETLSSAEVLLDTRYEAVQLLHECEEYLQMISNHPYTYDLKRSKVYKEYQAFEKQLKKYKPHKNKAEFLLGGRKAFGAGSVLLGPNAMLAAVTTFGLTPTSAVLGLLDGTATVNAALTWLCGGAFALGGGIMVAPVLFALAGPVGMAVGAGCSAANLLTADNKKKIQQAEVNTAALKSEIVWLRSVKKRTETLQAETVSLSRLVKKELEELKTLKKQEYSSFSGGEARKLGTMMNNAQSLRLAYLVLKEINIRFGAVLEEKLKAFYNEILRSSTPEEREYLRQMDLRLQNHQARLDELYRSYCASVEEEYRRFAGQVKTMDSVWTRQTAKAAASVQLAESSGVKKEKIIHSTKELDEKFGKRERKGLFGFFKK